MNHRQLYHFLLLVALLFICAPVAFSQTAQVTGRVNDPNDAVVPGTKVIATNQGTGLKRETVTNDDGYYTIPLLPPGSYELTVQKDGFKPISRSGITLQVEQVARLDFKLEIGATSETVQVTGAAPLLQSESTSLGQVIATRPVSELPLNGRNFIQLIALSTGAYIPQRNNSLYQDFLIGINGNRIQNNNFLLDGVNNNTTDNNQAPILPSPDAIAELKVQSNLLPAEFGRGLGGTININIKSGTNNFHGALFEFIRNDKLDANNFFNAGRARPPFQQNQFGGALGGPVYLPKVYDGRNRPFWFADYQGTRIRKGLTRLFTVPTASLRVGDFSGLAPIYDPDSTSGNTRQLFPGNKVPSNKFDPVMQRYLPLYPLPNRPGLANNSILN